MPDPSAYETESEFMAACVPAAIDEGREQEQAVAMCLSMWRERKERKAGRRVRGEWLEKLRDLKDRIAEFVGWASYDEAEEDEDKPASCDSKALYTFKAKDGRTWLLTWTTNAFRDRDGEVFTTKAIEEYVERHEGDESKGRFQLWHLPGSEFGTIRWQGVVGRFLVEAGPFDETPLGQRFKAFFEANPTGHPRHAPKGWATSHGYSYKAGDRDDGVYDWFDKAETSILPFEAAANQHNPRPEVLSMNDRQKELLREIGGDTLVKTVEETGEARTKELEAQGIAYKEAEPAAEQKPAEAAQPEAAQPEPAPLDLKAIADGLHMGDLSDTIEALTAAVKEMTAKVYALEAATQEVKARQEAENAPRYAWFRGSQAAGTQLTDTPADNALKGKKPTNNVVAGMAAKMSGA